MFTIEKNKKSVSITVSLKRRKTASEKKITVLWPKALAHLKEQEPELEIVEKPDHTKIATNYEDGKGTVTWTFQIVEKKKKSSSIKNLLQQKKEKIEEEALTPVEEPATVEETSQSDQPAIVQEPTE